MGNNWCTASGFIAKLLIPFDEVDNADDMLPPPKAKNKQQLGTQDFLKCYTFM